jgi:hypothetical protein
MEAMDPDLGLKIRIYGNCLKGRAKSFASKPKSVSKPKIIV